MKTVFRVLAVLGALALLRLALPLGLAWVHYLSTPDFRDWAETHPSGDSLWREVIPEGVLIAEGLPGSHIQSTAAPNRGQARWPQALRCGTATKYCSTSIC